MKTSTVIAIAVPAVAAAGLGAYFILRKKQVAGMPAVYVPNPGAYPPPPQAPGRVAAAQLASTVGPGAAAGGGLSVGSAVNGLIGMGVGQASSLANKILPGSGTILAPVIGTAGKVAAAAVTSTLGAVGSGAKKALSKLKFW